MFLTVMYYECRWHDDMPILDKKEQGIKMMAMPWKELVRVDISHVMGTLNRFRPLI